MAYHFRNLVFEGGGVKGIAYVGAMQVLKEEGILPEIKGFIRFDSHVDITYAVGASIWIGCVIESVTCCI